MKTYKRVIAYQIILLPVLLQLNWQLENNALPIADAEDHFRIAYLAYLNFSEGLWQGLHFLFHSGGKPILFSAFAAPLLLRCCLRGLSLLTDCVRRQFCQERNAARIYSA